MKRILIGHRGVGKSSLLQRLSIYQNLYADTIPVYDLDREIEKMVGTSVTEVFSMMGESAFRQLEQKAFDLLLKLNHYMIAVGAGFPTEVLQEKIKNDKEIEVIWVRRTSDQWGRIFLDRPRLNPEMSQLEEFHLRFQAREDGYNQTCHWIYDLPEGQSFPSQSEREIFSSSLNSLGGGFTVLPSHARNYESFKSREWRWDFDFFELRDDVLSDQELEKFFVLLAKDQLLISFRRLDSSKLFLQAHEEGYRTDWPLELGALKMPRGIKILSVHDRINNESLAAVISRLESVADETQELKLAVEVKNFEELEIGLRWQGMDPARRSFLPRSENGRWAWVRRWLRDRQPLNFIRQGAGSSLDQPTLNEWVASPVTPKEFAAILGNPIAHSYSPVEHQEFFNYRQLPFFPIEIRPEEWNTAMPLLTKLGLKAGAITAPWKNEAYRFCDLRSSQAQEFQSVNTIWKKSHENSSIWCGENTDYFGLKFLIESLNLSESQRKATVIWGGGGTLAVVKSLLPEAQAYSVRSGKPRTGEKDLQPQVLIWAGAPDAKMPPDAWKPTLVIDLNYRDDSLAKEYGQKLGARYISGLAMFKAQAQAQQDLWQLELWKEDSEIGRGN